MKTTIIWRIDDYAKDGGPGEVWLWCSFYLESLRTWIKTIINKFAISNHAALILGVHAVRSYLKLICEYELHSLPNKKLVAQRIMVKTTSRSDHPWSAIFCVIVYFTAFRNFRWNSTKWNKETPLGNCLAQVTNFTFSLAGILFTLYTRSVFKKPRHSLEGRHPHVLLTVLNSIRKWSFPWSFAPVKDSEHHERRYCKPYRPNFYLLLQQWNVLEASTNQVIPGHGNAQIRRTLLDGYLFKYGSVKYQTFHQISEKASKHICTKKTPEKLSRCL